MFIDISVEYDCCHEEFIGNKVLEIIDSPKWVSYHTDKGKDYLKQFGIDISRLHERIKISNEIGKNILDRNTLKDNDVMSIVGGFYWNNKEHTKHL